MKDISQLFKDACTPYLATHPIIEFKESKDSIEIIKKGSNGKEDKTLLFRGGTKDQLYEEVLRTLLNLAFTNYE